MNAPLLPVQADLPHVGGELVQSLTYRQSYAPATPAGASSISGPPARRHLAADAPELLRTVAGGAWALVSATAALAVLVILVLAVVRVVGWLA